MNIFDLSARITLDSSQYEKGLKNAEGKFNGFGQKLGGLLKGAGKVASGLLKIGAAGIGAAATAVGGLAKNATDAYANYEQLVGGVETLFSTSNKERQAFLEAAKEAGMSYRTALMEFEQLEQGSDIILHNAANAYKTAGMSANDYMETVTSFSASLIQSLSGNTIAAAEYADMAIRDMSDNANKMGTSMDLIQNAYQGFAKQNYTMLDNLKLGYGGTKSEMERLIKDAEKLDSSFSATRDENKNLTLSYSDIVDAIHIVQTNMGITGTTALEAEKTISGSAASMKASWENLLVAFAKGENIEKSVSQLVESVKTYAHNMIPVFTSALKGIGVAVKEIGPIIVKELPAIVKEVGPSLFDAAVALIGALFDSIMTVIKDTDWVQVGKDIVNWIMNIDWAGLISGAAELLGGIAGALFGVLTGIFDVVIQKVGKWLYDNFGDAADLTWEGFIDSLGKVFANIGTWVMQNIVEPLVRGFAEALNIDGDVAVQAMYDWFAGIGKAVSDFVTGAINWGKDLIDNFINGIKSKWQALKDSVANIANTVKSFLGFSEPEKGPLSNFHTYAPDMMNLFMKGIKDNEKKLQDTVAKAFDFENEIVYNSGVQKASETGTGIGNVTIIVNGAEGQSVTDLAKEIERVLVRMQRQRKAATA